MKTNVQYLLLLWIVSSCHSKTAEETTTAGEQETVTPVTVTSVTGGPMAEYIELNATSTFLQSAVIKATANGYVTAVNAQIGNLVSAGQNVFVLITKEAKSIGNDINRLDSSFKFTGTIHVKSGITGYVSEISHQVGDYVQEGEQLAAVHDVRSFVFILNLPYELRPYVLNKQTVDLLLPDGKTLVGRIASVMPVVDSVSQTQNIVLKVNEKNLPSNLIAKVKVEKTARPNTVSLPKQSVLSDETQASFWVMKLLNDSTAIKVMVTKGIEMYDKIEILSPVFSTSDKFLVTGNYGLPDTAKIKVIQQ